MLIFWDEIRPINKDLKELITLLITKPENARMIDIMNNNWLIKIAKEEIEK